MTIFECHYCKNKFRNKSILNNHQQKAKYCLKIQGKKCEKYKCDFCDKKLSCKYSLKKHLEICSIKKKIIYQNMGKNLEMKKTAIQKVKMINIKY